MNDRIKELRRNLKLTQAAFAERIGAADSTVGNWEKGRQRAPENAVKSICREFNVRREWLETGAGEMFAPSEVSEEEKREAQKEFIVSVFKRLTEDQQDVILESLREYVEKQASSGTVVKKQLNTGTINGNMIQN